MLQEWNQGGRDGRNLVGGNVHVLQLFWLHNGEVSFQTRLDHVVLERTIFLDGRIGLRDHGAVLVFGRQVHHVAFVGCSLAFGHLPVRRFDETETVHLSVHTQAGDQPNVGPFWRFNGAQAAVVRVVHITDLKACALTAQTTWTQGRDAALVRHLAQRVGLVHELRQLVRSEEAVDDRAQRLGVDQVGWREHLIVTNVHALPNGAGHPRESHSELRVQLLSNRTNAAVAQVVNVVHVGVAVHKVQQRFDDADDVVGGQGARLLAFDTELPVDAESTHFSEVITLLREEEFVNDAAGRFQIWWLRVPQLAVDVFHRFLF